MRSFKLILLTLAELARQIFSLPTTIWNLAKNNRGRKAANKREAERIDRIRNPSKYLGV